MTEGCSPPSVISAARAFKMIGVIASVIDGVLVGAVYGLAAMGLTLIWGVMNVINLTHGAMIVLGMFALYFLASALGLPPYGAVPVTIILGFVFGVALYWIAVHRVIGRRAPDEPALDLRHEYGPDRARHGAVEHEPLQRSGRAARGDLAGIYLHRHAYRGGRPGLADRRLALSSALPHAHRQGDPRGCRQSRSGRAQRHSDDAGAGVCVRTGRGARQRLGHADRHVVSLHRAVGRAPTSSRASSSPCLAGSAIRPVRSSAVWRSG